MRPSLGIRESPAVISKMLTWSKTYASKSKVLAKIRKGSEPWVARSIATPKAPAVKAPASQRRPFKPRLLKWAIMRPTHAQQRRIAPTKRTSRVAMDNLIQELTLTIKQTLVTIPFGVMNSHQRRKETQCRHDVVDCKAHRFLKHLRCN